MKNKVRELRQQHGWSQTELGDKVAVSRQTIHAIETERYDPSLPLAFKFARVFGLTVENLFDDEDRRVDHPTSALARR